MCASLPLGPCGIRAPKTSELTSLVGLGTALHAILRGVSTWNGARLDYGLIGAAGLINRTMMSDVLTPTRTARRQVKQASTPDGSAGTPTGSGTEMSAHHLPEEGSCLMGNASHRGSYAVCGVKHPDEPEWICSLAPTHRGDMHRAYHDHSTAHRSLLYKSWLKDSKRVSDDDVAAAIADITRVLAPRPEEPAYFRTPEDQQRWRDLWGHPQEPIIDDIDRARGNTAVQTPTQIATDRHYTSIIADKDCRIAELEVRLAVTEAEVARLKTTLAKVRTRVAHVATALED